MTGHQRNVLTLMSFVTFTGVALAWPEPADSWSEHRRAGFPQETSHIARPSDTGRYTGYLAGGGAVLGRRGDAPLPHEGTWGWDFRGGRFRRHVVPGWWHGRRYQGGTGRYQTDGPTLLPRLE
jgi:hypothetical protein